MTEIATIRNSHELSSWTIDALRDALAEQITATAQHVYRLAMIWAELERRGEDMSALRSGIGAYLAPVAAGRLMPEAVIKLAGNRIALRAISALEVDQQRRLLERGTIAVRRTDGTIDMVLINRLTAADCARAIDPISGSIIPPELQRARARRATGAGLTARLIVPLTDGEHLAILDEARRLNVSASELVRRALRDTKLI